MYFSIKRRSNIEPETGDITGCSGTSFETGKKIQFGLAGLRLEKDYI